MLCYVWGYEIKCVRELFPMVWYVITKYYDGIFEDKLKSLSNNKILFTWFSIHF